MESVKTTKTPMGITLDINASPTTSGSSVSSVSSSGLTSNSGSSGFGFFSPSGKIDYMRIGLILVILLFLGINVFSYLGDFLQSLKELLAPLLKTILESLGYVVTEGTKDITQVTAEGAKLGIDVAAGTIESGVDVIQGQLDIESPNQINMSLQNQNQNQNQSSSQNKMNKTNKLTTSLNAALADAEENAQPLPDDATSSTQRMSSNKSGYCYIGEDRGFRSCIRVNENDVCMSGDIFPSKDICVNPSLRE